jgi:hypothetical protein
MSYVVKETKTYNQAADVVTKAAVEVINQIDGKPTKKNKPENGRLDANFNKKVKGAPLNNRIQLEVSITNQSPEQATVSVEAYPVDPVGNKLTFGVRGNPSRVVVDAFWGDLDKRVAG